MAVVKERIILRKGRRQGEKMPHRVSLKELSEGDSLLVEIVIDRENDVVCRYQFLPEQLAALEQQRTELQNADKTLEERIRRVENLRRIIEERWQMSCGFSREMSKALVDHIVVDSDESKTRISLDIFLTTGAEPIVSETQTSNSQLQMSFQRARSGYQGEYTVTYLVRWHLE